jgi:hypothetical protein
MTRAVKKALTPKKLPTGLVAKAGVRKEQGRGPWGDERRTHYGVFSPKPKTVDTRRVKASKHGDNSGEILVIEKHAADPRYGNFNANSGRHKIGKDGRLKFSWAGQEVELVFSRRGDKRFAGRTVNLYHYTKGIVIADAENHKIIWFLPSKKLPTPKT